MTTTSSVRRLYWNQRSLGLEVVMIIADFLYDPGRSLIWQCGKAF